MKMWDDVERNLRLSYDLRGWESSMMYFCFYWAFCACPSKTRTFW
jgi:hypothetical protein